MRKITKSSKFIAITSGLLCGIFLNLILTGGISAATYAINTTQIIEALLLVVAVVGGVAWITYFIQRPAKKQETE